MAWKYSNRKTRLPANWGQLRKNILRRDKGVCQLKDDGCSVRATEVDHIKAGDDHRPENLRAVCTRCHSKKSSAEGHAQRGRKQALKHRAPRRHPGLRE